MKLPVLPAFAVGFRVESTGSVVRFAARSIGSVVTIVVGAVSIATAPSAAAAPGAASGAFSVLVSQTSRAEQTCLAAARNQGLRVIDITDVNETSDGAEVILEVRQGRNGSANVGCDYANATREVSLYRIESDDTFDNDNDDDNDWQNQYSGDGIRSDSQAESIARRVVSEQLGIDADADVVRIDDVARGDRTWTVEGKANGAPFRIRLRADDGSVEDFQLF